ncbi:cobalamin-binding protein [Pseudomonas mangiferae]|uniref:Cobalamin-binding protein n=1 Tax=Pseudomonas mangiferae TaxID=2593654 RepID=A0A553GUB3_9PSED|nr:cobalamin-binding protein [Pseudomonas mangiferae]TRX73104.1 cobalamin-binding protein [Pseudomonas mangiferae]
MARLLAGLLAAWLATTAMAAPPRVVSLAPSLSEIMLDLDAGDLLVGVLDGGERPAALRGVPSVGRYGQVEAERLLALRPDLVLLWPGSVPPAQREQLQRFGIPTYVVEPHSLDELARQFAEIGTRIGQPARGQARAAQFAAGLAELRRRYRRETPLTVFYQVWNAPLYTVGGGQIISDALRTCGARNVFDDLRLPAPQVSLEAVLARDPQVVIAGSHAELDLWKDWPQARAVRNGHLLTVPDKGLERPSFQMLEATRRLCEQLAPIR